MGASVCHRQTVLHLLRKPICMKADDIVVFIDGAKKNPGVE